MPDSKIHGSKVRQIAVAVRVDPRTVKRVIDGKPTRPAAGDAIREELKRRGLR